MKSSDVNALVHKITGISPSLLGESQNSNRGPESVVWARDKKSPKDEMPPKEADDMDGVSDQDDDEDEVDQIAAKESVSIADVGVSVEEWARLSGMPLTESDGYPVSARVGHSGEVPTAGVSKENKLKGGYPGLQGTPVQPVEPEQEGEGGDSEEMTLDDAVAMLKKEGVDMNSLWREFLGERGLTASLFGQLCDEAVESNDPEELDALLAVESIFYENMLSRFLAARAAKKQAQSSADAERMMAPVKAAGNIRGTFGPKMTRGASRAGVQIGAPGSAGKIAKKKIDPLINRKIGVQYGPPLTPDDDDEHVEVDCDDDGAGNPNIPWAQLAKKWS